MASTDSCVLVISRDLLQYEFCDLTSIDFLILIRELAQFGLNRVFLLVFTDSCVNDYILLAVRVCVRAVLLILS